MIFNEANMDPMAVASLLDVLAEALREPGGGPKTPGDLGKDLASMVEVTKKWASEHGIPPACVPTAPGPDVTHSSAAEFLTNLAKVVRYLGLHATSFETMAEVVALLKARQAFAIVELAEYDLAIKQMLGSFLALEETMSAVSEELSAAHDATAAERFAAIRDAVAHAHESLQQIVAAMREVSKGLDAWRVVEQSDLVPPSRRG